MIEKIKALLRKDREVLLYLLFGGLTTLVDFGVSFLLYRLLGDAMEQNRLLIHAADAVAWVCAVLFAFFTNKKWVFTDARPEPLWKQLSVFAASRLVTLGLDVVITYLGVLAFAAIWPEGLKIILTFTPEFMAKVAASVVVVIGNYVLSKIFVFKKDKD